MTTIDPKKLEPIIREILADISRNDGGDSPRRIDKSGVISMRTAEVETEPFPFDIGPAGARVRLKDMLSLEESPRLGCGVMEMDSASFKWNLDYDEVDYVIEGTLEIVIDDRQVLGKPGDTLFIPAGSAIEFSAPGFTRFLYVRYPSKKNA